MLPSHISFTESGLYQYRRRRPKELKEYISSDFIIKSLGKDTQEASRKAVELNQVIDQSILLVKIHMSSVTILTLLDNVNLSSITDGNINDSNAVSKITEVYLRQSQVTPLELANRTHSFKSMFPALLQVILGNSDPSINDLSFDKIIKIRDLIPQPKGVRLHRNIVTFTSSL